jgi:site-specific recombinase XerD
MTNDAMVREYVDWFRNTRGRAGSSAYNYASTLSRLNEYAGDTAFEDMSLGRLEGFIQLPRRGGLVGAHATQAKDVAVVREFYKYLHSRGHITRNPAALLFAPKVSNNNPKPIPDDDVCKLWDAATDGVERTVLGLGAFAGLRRREMCELMPKHLFVPGQRLQGFKRKGGGDDITPYGDLCEIVAHELPHLPADQFPDVLARYHERRKRAPYLLEWGEQVPCPLREQAIHELAPGMTDPGNTRLSPTC